MKTDEEDEQARASGASRILSTDPANEEYMYGRQRLATKPVELPRVVGTAERRAMDFLIL